MTLDALIEEVSRRGVRLEARGDRLHVEGPRGTLTPELRDALAVHKPALLGRLAPVAAEYVSLRGGFTVPRPAFELALDLERRGYRQTLDAAEQYQIEPTRVSGPLTAEDRAAIARWKLHLAAIVAYEAPTCA